MKSRYLPGLFALVLLIVMTLSSVSGAQILGLLTLERLSILDTFGTGARPMAMGGAYTAVSDDAFGLLYNPAGLTMIEDKEISIGIHHSQIDIDDLYDTFRGSTSNSYTSFGHLAYVQPYDSYKGNIVFGAGIFRVGSSDLEYVRSAVRPDLEGTIQNTFLQSGSIYQYRFGVGADLTRSVSVGANLVLWNESLEFNETISFEHGSSDSSYYYNDNVSADLDGFSLEFGILVWLSEYLRAGATISTPSKLYFDGDGVDSYTGTSPGGSGWTTDDEYYYIDDEFTLPMKFTGGIAVEVDNLLLAADFSWSDYAQTDYNGLSLINENEPLRDVLEDVFAWSVGGEFTFPGTEVSLRAGYSHQPIKLMGLDELTWILDTPSEWGLVTEYDFVEIKDERQFFTFGIGGVVDEVLALDIGVVYGSFERTTQFLTDKRETTHIVFTGAYRF